MTPIVPVLLCGGAGTRLWPASRTRRPKPLLDLVGQTTLLEATVARASGLTPHAPWLVGASDLETALRSAGGPSARLLLEPEGRGTAAAVAAVALLEAPDDPLLLVLPSDHHVVDPVALAQAVQAAARLADEGALVVFGVPPTHAATGFGWIAPGAPRGGGRKVDRFVEKPAAAEAARLLADGALWNAGIFLFRARALLHELHHHAPAILGAVEAALPAPGPGPVRLGPAFLTSPADPLDVAVFERTASAAVVPLNAGWSDLGTWSALWAATPHDEAGNAAQGDVLLVDTHDCLVRAEHRLVTTLGVHDLVVVETADAVLVAERSASERTREVVTRLARAGREEVHRPTASATPWGREALLDTGPGWAVKRLDVRAGEALSLQVHARRAERWVVVAGSPTVEVGDRRRTLVCGDVVEVAAGEAHRLLNDGDRDAVLVEVQLGDPDERDIVRLDDRYGRSAASDLRGR